MTGIAGKQDMATLRAPGGAERADSRAASWALGSLGVAVVLGVFVVLVPGLRHWMVLPLGGCGVLVAPDVVDWLRRRLDLFDPQAAVALMGVHFFLLAPLLHVTLDYWPRYIDPLTDWRGSLGEMAVLNFVGLLLYRVVLSHPDQVGRKRRRDLDTGKVVFVGSAVALASAAAFVAVIMSFGGPTAYLESLTAVDRDVAGYGLFFLVSAAFPLVGFLVVLVRARDHLRDHRVLLFALVVAFVVLQFAVAGLRGSRSSVIWPVLIAIGMCHLVVIPLRRRVLVTWLLAMVGFMYLYGFYKSAGVDAIDILTGDRSIQEVSTETGRDLPLLLLGDLGRSDIQALTLERQRAEFGPMGHGVTYVGDLMFLVPHDLRPALPDKVAVGTDMLYGEGTFASGFRSSQIYGLTGEAMLNFGVPGAVLSFVPFGFVVRFARARYRAALDVEAPLGEKLLAPMLPVVVILALTSDLDNIVWFLINTMVIVGVIVMWSRRTDPISHPT